MKNKNECGELSYGSIMYDRFYNDGCDNNGCTNQWCGPDLAEREEKFKCVDMPCEGFHNWGIDGGEKERELILLSCCLYISYHS